MKYIITVFIFLSFLFTGFSQSIAVDKLSELNKIMEKEKEYDGQKEAEIKRLQEKLSTVSQSNLAEQYDLSVQLYNAYKVFKYDSAYQYSRKAHEIAYRLQDSNKIAYSGILVSFTLLSSGLFKETADTLDAIHTSHLPDSIEAEYYAVKARYFYDMADYANDDYHKPVYNKEGGFYLDKALALYTPSSFNYSYYSGLKDIRSGNKASAQINFEKLIAGGGLSKHELALTASTLSDIYIQNKQTDSAIYLLADAATADIESSTKETSAMFNLAQLLYKEGNVKDASMYIEYAINDAAFYGARQRKVQLISILPLIEAEKINKVESQKAILITYAVAITFLLLIVVVLAITVYRQVVKLKHAQKVIYDAHQKEHEVNQQLAETNRKLSEMHVKEQEINEALAQTNAQLSDVNFRLSEANKIKEEYIGYFFNANSEFFNRIERFKKSVEQKIADRKIEEIKFLVNSINLRKEKEDLLRNFDKAFLRIFPHFVEEFNQFFKEEDRVELKDGEILNTDLRIFALIRMGINDIGKISQILEYSVNTINTYKTRIKNKSIIPNEEFEKRIMNIKTI
ncbi:DUF6377 domain-containing protein [Ferruginibacter albus]|uniref:DUF6377 domain-containing protein n=1 Tax=Ferruginibacter albus TaxID=2875540 RepID=UPI001CC7BFAB|nr:DUF6377 domain-containing protein [Ferruginibacter albus]UAY51217.1 DUF6377 domain-containing protein [Ferruginibacter albus]